MGLLEGPLLDMVASERSKATLSSSLVHLAGNRIG